MIEAIGLLLAITATVWVRKQDVLTFVCDEDSHYHIKRNILFPTSLYAEHAAYIKGIFDDLFGHGYRFFFSLYMLSMFYTSISFTASLLIAEPGSHVLGSQPIGNNASQAFYLFGLAAFLCFTSGKLGGRYVDVIRSDTQLLARLEKRVWKKRGKRLVPSFAALGVIFSLICFLLYESFPLAIYALVLSVSTAIFNLNGLPFVALNLKPWRVALGGALGALGLLVVAMSFSSAEITLIEVFFLILLSVLSGLLAYFAAKHAVPQLDIGQKGNFRFNQESSLLGVMSLAGRPSHFVGMYCIRSSGPFVLSVTILLIALIVGRSFLPGSIVNAGVIESTCFIFLSGATTLAGSGIFMFGVMILLLLYMLTKPFLLLGGWSSVLIIWVILPLLNTCLDWLRWNLTRKELNKVAQYGPRTGIAGVLGDAIVGLCTLVLFAAMFTFIVTFFDYYAATNGVNSFVKAGAWMNALREDFWSSGTWLFFMGMTALFPTIVRLGLYLYTGLTTKIPNRLREELWAQTKKAKSAFEQDGIAWRLSVLDISGRIILSTLVLILIVYVGYNTISAFEYVLVFVMSYCFEITNAFLN